MSQEYTDTIAAARHANLTEYFLSRGYDVEQRRNELHIRGYGGLYVNSETNQWYCFSKSEHNGGKNAINCLTEIIGLDFKTAVSELTGCSLVRPQPQRETQIMNKKRSLELPEKSADMKRVFAYLCQTRKIDAKTVSALVHDGLLYQDNHGNAVFLHKNNIGEIVGAELQGTNSYKRFKGVAAGTADSVFSLNIGVPIRAYVFESAIDLLSFYVVADRARIQNSVLVSMAGLKPNSLKQFSDKGMKLYSCVDNDEAGIRFTSENKLIPCNRILSENGVKDFNELLQKIVNNNEMERFKQDHSATVQQNQENTSPRITHPRR